jgi:hypothetical protein
MGAPERSRFYTRARGSFIIDDMRPDPDPSRDDRRPEVIVDFTSTDGLLFVVLRNIHAERLSGGYQIQQAFPGS